MEAALTAFALVFVAELGDKSMLLAIAFAARYRPWPVLGGIALAAVIMLGASTALGAALGAALPGRALTIGGGLLFLAFGVWALLDREDDEDATTELSGRSVLVGVSVAFLVAELGDKTMIATAALAGTQPPLPTWVGAAVGMTLASGIAVGLASLAGSRLPERVLRTAAAVVFLLFGALLLVDGLVG